jgi:isopenicillin N synthase-like dioxygenase
LKKIFKAITQNKSPAIKINFTEDLLAFLFFYVFVFLLGLRNLNSIPQRRRSMKTDIIDLKTRGFIALPYPSDVRLAVEKAMKSWKEFCALPMDLKRSLPYSLDEVGYDFRNGSGTNGDHKENLDVTLAGYDWLETHAKHIGNPVALACIREFVTLVHLLKPIVLDFAKQSEETFGLEGFTDEVNQSEDVFFVRFIHYFGADKSGEEIAHAHTDKSGFTLHLFESAPGLQCLTYNRTWIDMPVTEGETVIIPAMQMQLRSKGELKALCHRVISTTETAKEGRFAAVCFVQLKRTPKYNKATYSRLQEKNPGFNYTMTHEEFQTLFKP